MTAGGGAQDGGEDPAGRHSRVCGRSRKDGKRGGMDEREVMMERNRLWTGGVALLGSISTVGFISHGSDIFPFCR